MKSMKRRILVCLFVTLVVSVFISSDVFAECPEGKNPIQLTTPSGKTKTLCVPDAAMQGIENAAEHSGGTIVTASCDCWSQSQINDIDANAQVALQCYMPGIIEVGVDPQYECDVVYSDTGKFFADAFIIFPRDKTGYNYECKNYWIPDFKTGFSKEEYDACVALIEPYLKK